MAEKTKNLPASGGRWSEADAALLKGALGTIPVVGSILSEVVGLIIPSQRQARIEAYLALLDQRLRYLEPDSLRHRFQDPETVDLFEEGAVQSLRALSDERKAHIATIVANGISGEAKGRIEAKRLLKLLAQIDDDQVVILMSYLDQYREDREFSKRHENLLAPRYVFIGAEQSQVNDAAIHDLARSELLRLGLIADVFSPFLKKGQIPEFGNRTGKMKASHRGLTALGRLLLTRMALAESGES